MMNTKFGSALAFCALAAIALLFHWHGRVAAQSTDDGFKHFENSIVSLPRGAEPKIAALNEDARQRKLELHFALVTNNIQELESRVAKGETVSPAEMRAKYSGDEEQFNRLLKWLKGEGFQITQTSADYTNVFAKA